MKLPILPVVKAAFTEAALHWRALLRALIIPAAVLSVLEFLQVQVVVDQIDQEGESFWWLLPLWAAQGLVYVLYATSCHRIVLLGDDSLPNRWGLFWTARETRFLGWSLVVLLLLLLGLLPFFFAAFLTVIQFSSNVTQWLEGSTMAVAFPLAIYVMFRASLVLPATAIDQRLRFGEAWRLSQGNGWRLSIALVIPTLLLVPLRHVSDVNLGTPELFFPSVLASLWICLVAAVEVTVLSVAFRTLTSTEPGSVAPDKPSQSINSTTLFPPP